MAFPYTAFKSFGYEVQTTGFTKTATDSRPGDYILIIFESQDYDHYVTGYTHYIQNTNFSHRLNVFYKVATATNETWSTSGALRNIGWQQRVIRRAQGIAKTSVVKYYATTTNPPALTPSWGEAQTLWVACWGGINSKTNDDPDNYTDRQFQSNRNCNYSSTRQLKAASEDPSIFDMTALARTQAFTLAFQPAESTALLKIVRSHQAHG